MKFRAVIQLGGKTATGLRVPDDVVTSLGSSKRPAARVTINGYTYPSTVAPMGGQFMLPVSAEVRQQAGVVAGDEVASRSILTLRRVRWPSRLTCGMPSVVRRRPERSLPRSPTAISAGLCSQ